MIEEIFWAIDAVAETVHHWATRSDSDGKESDENEC